jgi:hypothetical protein
MQVEPQNEHRWLEQLAGNWTYEHECDGEPDKPPHKVTGEEAVRSLGGVWILCEGRGEMPGGGIGITQMTLGYDPLKKRFVGTFIGSMMTHLWIYDGVLDAAGKVLTLDTEGPSFTDPTKMIKYQDLIEIKNADYRILSSQTLGEDGQWHPFMTAHYRRKK